jgi:hypothetical protein
MGTHNTLPILDDILALARPEEKQKVQTYFEKCYTESDGKKQDSTLISYEQYSAEMREKAAKMLYWEYCIYEEKQKLNSVQKRWELYKSDFMIDVEEQLYCVSDSSEQYYFDPISCHIKAGRKNNKTASSIENTVVEYAGLVRQALESPLAAGRMASDSCLPQWLQSFAAAIVEPGFRKGLRLEVERALNDTAHARMWATTAREDGMDPWIADLFDILGSISIK